MSTGIKKFTGFMLLVMLGSLLSGCEVETDYRSDIQAADSKVPPASKGVKEQEPQENWPEVLEKAEELGSRVDELDKELERGI